MEQGLGLRCLKTVWEEISVVKCIGHALSLSPPPTLADFSFSFKCTSSQISPSLKKKKKNWFRFPIADQQEYFFF